MSTKHIYQVGTQHNLEKIIIEMENEYVLQHPFSQENCSAYLLQFLATAGSLITYHQDPINLKYRKSMEEVCKYMYQNYQENLLSRKINVAKRLIEDTDMSLSDIAEITGFEDTNYFSRMFKKVMGHSPKYYRQLRHTFIIVDITIFNPVQTDTAH